LRTLLVSLLWLMMDVATYGVGHLGRFFTRIGEMAPADMKVGDVLTKEELQAVWRETADEGMSSETIGRYPLIH
jgi:hypothetical protein